jgi:hypothetical protein
MLLKRLDVSRFTAQEQSSSVSQAPTGWRKASATRTMLTADGNLDQQ